MPNTLHVVHRGAKGHPPLLMIHGICASTRYWTERMGRLDEIFHCTIPDLLGHGKSPKPSGAKYDVHEHADAMEPLLEQIVRRDRHPVSIIAHSMGNIIAIELRRRHPDLIGPIVGFGVPYFPTREAGHQAIEAINPFAKWTIADPWYARHLLGSARLSRGKVGFPWFHKNYGLPRDAWEDGFMVTWDSLMGSIHNLILGSDIPGLLRAAGTRDITWWHGTHDVSAPFVYTQQLWSMFPEVPHHVVPGGTHNIWIFQNAELSQAILPLLQGSEKVHRSP